MNELDPTVVRQAMAFMGHIGGSVRSERKAAAARINGRKGGRPKKAASAQQPALGIDAAPQATTAPEPSIAAQGADAA